MKPKYLLPAMAVAGVLAASAWQLPKNPGALPPPFATPSAENRPEIIEPPTGAALKGPQGFQISEWASGFDKPRFLLQGKNGEILLSDSSEQGKVYAFPNGNPKQGKPILEGLNRPYGLALIGDYLYVAEADVIKRYPYDGRALIAGTGDTVVSLAGFNKGHWTRSLLADPSGEKLYVGIGSGSNIDTGEDPHRAAVHVYNPDGSDHRRFATGLRNPVGMHWYPGTNDLWVTVQERDGLGDDLVPDYMAKINAGEFYGWPYAYIGSNIDPRVQQQRPDLVEQSRKPDVLLGAHVSALDFTFYTGDQFPPEYRGGAFVALHGSWNRSEPVGYSIAFVPFRNGKPSGPPQDFLTGWRVANSDPNRVWGRPVAVFQTDDGSLLITDDGGKKIWKVTYRRTEPRDTSGG